MASYTTNLNLLKKNPLTEGNDAFNIDTMLNDNWDKIDAGVGALEAALSVVDTLVRPNLLKNAYFVGGGSQQGPGYFPINSKGQTSYSQIGNISIDHWCVDVCLTISSNFITIQENTIYQYGETALLPCLMGKSVTASALLSDGTLISGTVVFPTALPQSQTGYLFGNSGLECVIFPNGEFQSLRIPAGRYVAAKLEVGDTQTLAHYDATTGTWVLNEIPDYNEELVRCMDTPSQIETGSYVGTGTSGSANANSLTFGFTPKIVIVQGSDSFLSFAIDSLSSSSFMGLGYVSMRDAYNSYAYAKYSGMTLSWYSNNTSYMTQANSEGKTYYYIAIG